MTRMIDFYNSEVVRFNHAFPELDKKTREANVDNFIDTNPTKISWTVNLKQELLKNREFTLKPECLTLSLYRPFTKQWLYFDRTFNERVLQMPRIFPDSTVENQVICVSGIGARSGFSALMANALPNLDTIEKAQCFPLYLYEPNTAAPVGATPQGEMFDGARMTGLFDAPPNQAAGGYRQRDGMTDAGLAHFAAAYPSEKIRKADVFYYIYGLLHSEDYKTRYADNLSKELPRIPCVKTAADFWAFSQAGRALAELHLNYETVAPYPVQFAGGELLMAGFEPRDYRVEQMKFAKGKDGAKHDKTSVIYNPKITLTGIPLAAFDYIVNGKPALEWVMERQAVTTHKDSGITNDANDWAIETMGNARYPLELFMRVITVSLETMKIVRSLPRM
jgi:predicted helicase